MIDIRPLIETDRDALEGLLSQIHQYYYGQPRTRSDSSAVASALIEDGYTDTLIAWDGTVAVGLAIYTFLLPAERPGSVLYLKELFVSDRARNQGLGRRLMARLAEIGKSRGCSRLDWTAQRGNAGTMRFYNAIGATELTGKAYFRIEGTDFDAFIDRLDG